MFGRERNPVSRPVEVDRKTRFRPLLDKPSSGKKKKKMTNMLNG